MTDVALVLNGIPVRADVEPRTSLADYIRDAHNLTGTHLGCEHGVCGACTVLIDGVPARSCITFVMACANAEVTTIEGLDDDEIMTELRAAFSREHGLQCGYCTPGMLVSARDLVLRAPDADEHAVRVGMSGNLCRCTGYVGIVCAIRSVISDRRARGEKAMRGGGRVALGPVGAGHAKPINARAARPTIESVSVQQLDTVPPAVGDLSDWKPEMTFDQNFTVGHRLDEVWGFFAEVPKVAACLPGASVEGDTGGRRVRGKIRVKVGPLAPEFHGIAEIDRDEATHSGTIRGSGQDAKSGSTTRGVISYRLSDAGSDTTRVDLSIGYRLTGPLAQFSRSDLMRDIAGRLVALFAQNVAARLGAPRGGLTPAPELGAASLFFSVLKGRIKARLRRMFRPRA